jgi:acyl-CoA thioesterase-1
MLKLLLPLLITSVSIAQTKIVCLGDSLTEGYGVSKEQAYPYLLEKLFIKNQLKVKVINAGISGSTTASAPKRLKWYLRAKPDIVLLALGANDGLRGVELKTSKANLAKTIEMAQLKKIKVVLAGMKLPPNYGKKYVTEFEKMYSDLAKKYQLTLIPFLLEGVGGQKELNQADGIHPNEKGYQVVAQKLYHQLRPLL